MVIGRFIAPERAGQGGIQLKLMAKYWRSIYQKITS
jgi:hypothetical protein